MVFRSVQNKCAMNMMMISVLVVLFVEFVSSSIHVKRPSEMKPNEDSEHK